MANKRSGEAASIEWVKKQGKTLAETRADMIAAHIIEELKTRVGQKRFDAPGIDLIIDRAWDRGNLPDSKEAVAFEIWNLVHVLGAEITDQTACRYVPKMEGGPVPARLRRAFRAWYEK